MELGHRIHSGWTAREAATADQDHDYTPEQQAFHGGLMDGFPKYTGTPGPPPNGQTTNGLVMGYYDGNTVTAFWNYAQQLRHERQLV